MPPPLEPSGRDKLLFSEEFISRRSVGSGSDLTMERSESDWVGEEWGRWWWERFCCDDDEEEE